MGQERAGKRSQRARRPGRHTQTKQWLTDNNHLDNPPATQSPPRGPSSVGTGTAGRLAGTYIVSRLIGELAVAGHKQQEEKKRGKNKRELSRIAGNSVGRYLRHQVSGLESTRLVSISTL